MELSLMPMTAQDFTAFQERSERIFVSQLVETGRYTRVAAVTKAREEGRKLLPEGLQTKGAVLLTVLRGEKQIGYLWFGIRGDSRTAFTYAFEILERGYGYSAMLKAREYLRGLGVTKVQLHAFAKNERAIELYKAVGFQVDSYNMSVEL